MSDVCGRLVIFGAWYFGRVIAEAAQASGWDVLGFVDPNPPEGIGTLTSVEHEVRVFVAIGDNLLRAKLIAKLRAQGRTLATIQHPKSSVSPSASLGDGCYVAEFAAVRTAAQIGQGVVLQAGCVVSHDCRIEDFSSFGPNAAAASKLRLGKFSAIGAGASIAPGVSLGENCTVAAGAAVFKDAKAAMTLVGNPARATPSPERSAVQSDWSANDVW